MQLTSLDAFADPEKYFVFCFHAFELRAITGSIVCYYASIAHALTHC